MIICQHCAIVNSEIIGVHQQTRLRIGGNEFSVGLCEQCKGDLSQVFTDWLNPKSKLYRQVIEDIKTRLRKGESDAA